ncbi:MAG: hypothetical protein IJI14_10900 [Anaerolineaceae bacterium]|nr:hypothetical protein [Anaerolineaceae bacterium]
MNKIKKANLIPIVLLLAVFAIGLILSLDFNVSTDEQNQVEAGHVIWKYLCQKTGIPIPDPIKQVPELYTYYNRYYGQAATFPTVILEALRGFTLDTSTILRIRHLWNFLCYFTGLCCFTAMITQLYSSPWMGSLALLFMIFLPRIFGDIFNNDRDTMVLGLMMTSLFAFYRYLRRPGWLMALLCGMIFAITFNSRMFGLLLLIFPLICFPASKHKKLDLALILTSIVFWILFSPIYWEDPLHSIPDSFTHLSSVQRSIDTQNGETTLFFGEKINENDLPWYYLPVYIFISTPLATSLAALLGTVIFLKRVRFGKSIERDRLGIGMLVILYPFILCVILFKPALYNGWRHFYFLNLPIVWMALEGSNFLAHLQFRPIRHISLVLFAASIFCSASWMISVHPYYDIYLNPIFRKHWMGSFDRDFWDLSATEGVQYLTEHADGIAVNVTDNYWIKNILVGFPPAVRERFHTLPYIPQPYPMEYVFFNYTNESGNEKSFAFYAPVYSIERDGIKLAEIFRRSHNAELETGSVIESINSDADNMPASYAADGDYDTILRNTETGSSLMIGLNKNYTVKSIEIFPEKNYPEFPDFKLFSSNDGAGWTEIAYSRTGWNGISFSDLNTSFLKIEMSEKCPGIRDMLFYGTEK